MNKRPIILTLYAWAMWLTAGSFYLQAAVSLHISVADFESVLRSLTYLNYLVMLTCFLAGILAWTASHSLLYAALALVILVAMNNAIVAAFELNFSASVALFGAALFAVGNLALFVPEVRLALSNPRLHWWKVAARRKFEAPVVISNFQESFRACSFDFSKSGMYLTALQELANGDVSSFSHHFRTHDPVEISIPLNGKKSLTLIGRVARFSDSSGRYPQGMGIRLEGNGIARRWFIKGLEKATLANVASDR